MTVIATLDDRNGSSLCGKRLSKDREILGDIEREFPHVHASEYTAALFTSPGYAIPIPDPVPADAVLFLELEDIPADADELIIYRWNRRYPSDREFDPAANGWRLISSSDFAGYSHRKITKERYAKG